MCAHIECTETHIMFVFSFLFSRGCENCILLLWKSSMISMHAQTFFFVCCVCCANVTHGMDPTMVRTGGLPPNATQFTRSKLRLSSKSKEHRCSFAENFAQFDCIGWASEQLNFTRENDMQIYAKHWKVTAQTFISPQSETNWKKQLHTFQVCWLWL